MTHLTIEGRRPLTYVEGDAETIADSAAVSSVIAEDTYDDVWIVKVLGPTQGDSTFAKTEEQFEDLCRMIESIVSGEHSEIKEFYDPGSRYLVRIEY